MKFRLAFVDGVKMNHQHKTTTSINKYLSNVIQESLKNVRKQRVLKEEDDLFSPDAATKDSAGAGEKISSSPPEDEKEKLKKGDVTSEDVIEKLNSIRAGKSFKDPDISNDLKGYVDGMSTAERTALFAFLKGISQIVTGEFDQKAAIEPSDAGPGVEMKKKSVSSKISIKPTVVKVPVEKKEKKPSAEDTTGPVPISPKKK